MENRIETWTVKVKLTVGGHPLPQVDITPLLGMCVVGMFAYFMFLNSWVRL